MLDKRYDTSLNKEDFTLSLVSEKMRRGSFREIKGVPGLSNVTITRIRPFTSVSSGLTIGISEQVSSR